VANAVAEAPPQPATAPAVVEGAVQPASVDGVQIARRRHRRAPAKPAPSPEAQQASAKPQPYNIVINVPACRLRLYENGKVIKVYPVCVGMPQYRSPAHTQVAINRILWNPSWSPPPEADWARGSAGRGPGKWNPVGLVKMPLKGYVFVHGTYKIKSLGFAWSHGCFRMANEDAVELAWFLQTHIGSNHPEHTLDFYKNNHRTFLVFLNQKVPAETIYETIEVADNKLLIHPDIYRMGTNSEERVMAKLQEAGWPTNNVDMNRVRQLIVRSKQETAIANKEYLIAKGN
jgi:lipoprotein-anchoring transpeptidase ErfK/SrfK